MHRLAIVVLAFSLAAASAQAQVTHPTTYGTFAPNKSPPKSLSGGTFAPTPAPKSPGNTDGGKPFKPFKGTSTYDGPGAFKPYKPAKPKSVFDR